MKPSATEQTELESKKREILGVGGSDSHPARDSWVQSRAACWLREKVAGTFLVGFHL